MKSIQNIIVISLAVIITGAILAHAWVRTHRENESISVTGSAARNIVSDLIKWQGQFKRRAGDVKTAYDQLKQDEIIVRNYLKSKGVPEKEIVFNAVNTREINRVTAQGVFTNDIEGYELSMPLEIESHEVAKIQNITREATELINQGVKFESFEPQYFYTKLSDLKIEMLAAATKDARIRGEKIAENAGNKVGGLRSAHMGVLQITAKNSADFAAGGSLDTRSRDKTITAVVYLSFEVN